MGDSHISKECGQVQLSHCDEQLPYLELKQHIFGGDITSNFNSGFGEGKIQHSMFLLLNEQTRYLRNLFYVNGKKTVKNVLDLIDEKALAFWYMDDGCHNHSNGSHWIGLSTESFTYADHLLLREKFEKKWNITFEIDTKSVKYHDENRVYPVIRFNAENSRKVWDMIHCYIQNVWNINFLPIIEIKPNMFLIPINWLFRQ